jgi:hypothetical protein
VPGPLGHRRVANSKGGRSRTLCACFGGRLRTQEHALVGQRKGRDSNPQGLFASSGLQPGAIMPVGLPFRPSCPGRTRTYTRLGNNQPHHRCATGQSSVPAAGVEPAAFAFSARRSYRLSYTGIGPRRRQESNLLRSRVAADRLAVRPRRPLRQEPAVGLEPTSSALRAVPNLSSIAGIFSSQCWCRANSTEVQSLRPLPRAWPASDPEPEAGIEPARFPLQEGCSTSRAALALEGGRRESNPHNPGSQPGLAAALSSATVLQPGIEPGTRPSQSRVMSLSPSKQEQYPGQESNLDLLFRGQP